MRLSIKFFMSENLWWKTNSSKINTSTIESAYFDAKTSLERPKLAYKCQGWVTILNHYLPSYVRSSLQPGLEVGDQMCRGQYLDVGDKSRHQHRELGSNIKYQSPTSHSAILWCWWPIGMPPTCRKMHTFLSPTS